MEDWAETMDLLASVGRALQRDPTDFEGLADCQSQIQKLLDRPSADPGVGVLFFLDRYLAYVRETFALDNFMDAEAALAARAEALELIGKTLELGAQRLSSPLNSTLYCLVQTLLSKSFLAAVDLVNGEAAEEAALKENFRLVTDTNP